jgi:methionine-rich copper-binding protein CopC
VQRTSKNLTGIVALFGVIAAAHGSSPLISIANTAPSVAIPHTHLERAEPAKDTTVAVAPKMLRLFFSEEIKPAVAGLRLLASDSSVVAIGALKNGDKDEKEIVAPITGTMKAGTYRVMWRVAGDDGHPVSGNYVFTVKPGRADN